MVMFDGRTYSAKDLERIEAEYFRELKKANDDNEKAFNNALRLFFPAKISRQNSPA